MKQERLFPRRGRALKAAVREKLRDFAVRQAMRNARRTKKAARHPRVHVQEILPL